MVGRSWVWVWGCLVMALSVGAAHAAGPPPPVPLATMIESADFVFKATALSSEPSNDAWFTTTPPRPAVATRLRPVAWYKGRMDATTVSFNHWPESESLLLQGFDFEDGRSYLVMASYVAETGQLRQLQRQKQPGSFPTIWCCADGSPRNGATPSEVVWQELVQTTRQGSEEQSRRAWSLLRQLSTRAGTGDYPVERLVDLLREQIYSGGSAAQADAAFTFMGSSWLRFALPADSYLTQLGHGTLPGIAAFKAKSNEVADAAWRMLAVVVDGNLPESLRGRAMEALAECHEPALQPMVRRWARSSEPELAWRAPLLLANFAGEDDLLRELSRSADARTRRNVAVAGAIGQYDSLLPRLVELLADADPQVRVAAAEALVCFPLAAHRAVLEPLRQHAEYGFLFLPALAREDATPYLAELTAQVRDVRPAPAWWRGHPPWLMAWDRLRAHTANLPADALAGPTAAQLLDTLELPVTARLPERCFDGPLRPCQLYEVYLRHALAARAVAFRERCTKELAFEVAKYFDQVDAAVAR